MYRLVSTLLTGRDPKHKNSTTVYSCGAILIILILLVIVLFVIYEIAYLIRHNAANSVEAGAQAYYAAQYADPDASGWCDHGDCPNKVAYIYVKPVTFTDVNVDHTGSFTLKLVYLTDSGYSGDDTLKVSINGQQPLSVTVTANGWSDVTQSTTITITLTQGNNTITVSAPLDPIWELNRIEVKPV